jgi:hypothetical protein
VDCVYCVKLKLDMYRQCHLIENCYISSDLLLIVAEKIQSSGGRAGMRSNLFG